MSPANQQPVQIEIKLDQPYYYNSFEPIVASFERISTYSSQLTSGAIILTTQYDNVLIEDTGSNENGRKATTGKSAADLPVLSFSFSPTTEADTAKYVVNLKPTLSFTF